MEWQLTDYVRLNRMTAKADYAKNPIMKSCIAILPVSVNDRSVT
ncbi:MAG: hypothetical protein H6R15_542 [Proteobacteria bacterium]|nr:hypothetical protein [Pseudomonadota bacterium]